MSRSYQINIKEQIVAAILTDNLGASSFLDSMQRVDLIFRVLNSPLHECNLLLKTPFIGFLKIKNVVTIHFNGTNFDAFLRIP